MGADGLDHLAWGDAAFADAAARARAAWRDEEQEWTAAAFEQWRHARTLVDRAREHLHRGDTIALVLPGAHGPLAGQVTGVGADVVVLQGPGRAVDVRLAAGAAIAWHVVHRARHGGTRGRTVESFRARLLEREAAGEPVEVATSLHDGRCYGHLTVGRDHVVLDDADGTTTVVALDAIQWVRAADG
jgi:hypothetical protein